MGSFCGSGTQRTTTNTSQTTTPTGQAQIQNIYDQIRAASQTPFTPYTGQMTASLSPMQQAAISNISGIAGGSPYLNAASQYAAQGASAIDPASIQNYINPYTQSVIAATQSNFDESNARQQQDVLGNAAKVGALGGNRVGVAQAELARQQKLAQDPVIANLQSNAYTQAVNAAQADRSAAQYGAGAFSGFNDAALRAAQAQLGAGSVEQGTNQAALQAQYQEFLRQQQNPYMNAGFLAQYGLPAASAMGSSTSGTQVQEKPGASPLNSILGLGTAALGLFTGNPMMALGGFGSSLGAGAYGGGSGGSTYSIGYGGLNMPVYAASGGSIGDASEFMKAVNTIRSGLRDNRRGASHFASGGLADRFSSVEDAISSGAFDPQGANYTAFNAAPYAVSIPKPIESADEPMASPVRTAARPVLPREIVGEQGDEAMPASALGYSPYERGSPSTLPVINVEASKGDAGSGSSLFGFPLSERARMALIQTGLGIAASQSPTLGGAIGEGGLGALKNYAQSIKDEREAENARLTRDQAQQRIDMEAKRLQQSAEQFAKSHGLAREKFSFEKNTPEKPTADAANLVMENNSRQARGLPPLSMLEYQQAKAKAGATNVNVGDKSENEFEKKLAGKAADRWNTYIEGGDAAQVRLADIQTLREASSRIGSQGRKADAKLFFGPYLEAAGINIDGLSDIQLFDSITKRLAPQLRAPGSGSTSDVEFKGFLASIGALSNNPAARTAILDTFEAASRNDLARADIATRLANKDITRADAEKEMRSLPNPMTAFREFKKANPDLYEQAIQEQKKRGSAKAKEDERKRSLPSGYSAEIAREEAKRAIASGKSRDAVIARLKAFGIDTGGL